MTKRTGLPDRGFNAQECELVYFDEQGRVATNSLLLLKKIMLRNKTQIPYKSCMEEFQYDSEISLDEMTGYWTKMYWSPQSKRVHDVFVFLELDDAVKFMEFWDTVAKTTDSLDLRSEWQAKTELRNGKQIASGAVKTTKQIAEDKKVDDNYENLQTQILLDKAQAEIVGLKKQAAKHDKELKKQLERQKEESTRANHEQWADYTQGMRALFEEEQARLIEQGMQSLMEMRALWLDMHAYCKDLESKLVSEHCMPETLFDFLRENKFTVSLELHAK